MPLEAFGFPAIVDNNPLEEPNERLRRIGGGVEAWAFLAEEGGAVYKFFLPREGKTIGSAFEFGPGEETLLRADARLGHYWELLEKLRVVQALGGMPSEVVAVTPEGILVAKQTLGEPLPQGQDVSRDLPKGLIEIPSRFLRANRDHPRLFFHDGTPWLVADLHARNLVRGEDGGLHVIDLVAAPWPVRQSDALCREWIERVRSDPTAGVLPSSPDDEL